MRLATRALRAALTASSSLLLFTVFLGTSAAPMAQTTLAPGDLVVLGSIADNPDSFSLLATVDIATGTEFKITDKGVGADGTIQPERESVRTFTTTAPIAAGDVLVASADATSFYPEALGTPTGGTSFISLSESGDQLIIYQGETSSPTFVFAFSTIPFDPTFDPTNGGDPTNVNQSASALPPGLVNGSTAIDFDPHVDNVDYDRTNGTSGTRAEILALVANDTNYTTSNDRFSLQGGAFTVTMEGGATLDFPITFEDEIDYEIVGFAGAERSEIVADPSDASNSVVRVIRDANAQTYAGTVIANGGLAEPVPFAPGATTISVRVWTPMAGTPVRFKVENAANGAINVETEVNTTMAGAWETLVFDLADEAPGSPALDFDAVYDKLVIFFDFGAAGAPEATYYFDDIVFGGNSGSGGALVINEVDADTPGSDTAEFVELYNAGDADVTLDDYVVVFFNGNGDVSYGAFDLTGTLAPGEYYVLGNPGVSNVDQTFDPGSSGFLQNGADAVALYTGAAADFPDGTAASTTNLVDAIVYETDDAEDEGLLAALGQTTQYDEAANGDKDNESVQRSPDGDATIITALATPGAANAIITEPETFTSLLRGENERPNPVETDAKGGVTAVLDGTTLTVTGVFAGLSGTFSGAHLHGGAADETGGVEYALTATTTADMFGGSFEAASNTFTVRETFADSVRAGLVYVNVHSSAHSGGEIRDQLGTDTHALPFALSGENERPNPVTTSATGAGTVSLDGSTVTVTGTFSGLEGDYAASHVHEGPADDNGDVVLTLAPTVDGDMRGGTFEAANNTFMMVRTTFADSIRAGLAYVNVHSSAHGGGEIRGQIGTEAPLMTISIADARDAGVGTTVRIEGTVSRALGDFAFIQDETGGLAIRQSGSDDPIRIAIGDGTIKPGTVLDITGTLSSFNGLLQINDADLDSYEITGQGDAPAAQTVTLAQIAASPEDYESELVSVENVTFADAGQGQFASSTDYDISDASDETNTIIVRVQGPEESALAGVNIPGGFARVTGVLGQFDSTDPRDEGYQIIPVQADDVIATPGVDTEEGAHVLSLSVANPIQRDATVRFTLDAPGLAQVALYDALGRQVAVLADGEMTTGLQTARLDAGSLASGVYVLRLESESGALSRTVTVVR